MSISTQSQASDFDLTLTAVCEAAVKLVGVDHSGLVLFDSDRRWGRVVAEYPFRTTAAVGNLIQLLGVPFEERLALSGEPIIVNDVKHEASLGSVQKVLLDLGINSIVVVPITVDGKITGSFSFDAIENRRFDEEDIQKCKSLAEFASIVVKNAHLLRNLEALRQAMLAITSEQDREPLLQTIIIQAVGLLGAKGGGIYEYDDRRKELDVIAAYRPPTDILGQTLQVGKGMAGRLIESPDDSLAIPNYSEWEYKAEIYNTADTFGSVLGVRLVWKENATGVLWVDAENGREFTPFEKNLLKRLAATASVAFEQTRLRERELYKVERLKRLAEATNSIVGQLSVGDRDKRLTLIAEHAHNILNAEACGVHLVERPGVLTLVANHGHGPGGVEKGKKFKVESGDHTGLTGHIAFIGKVFRACGEELGKHPAVRSTIDTSPSGNCHSLLAIPLKTELGELRGLIRISNKLGKDKQPHPWSCFSDDDQAIGEIFAQAAMVEIETADLLDEIKKGETRYRTLLEACKVIVQARKLEDGLAALANIVMNLLDKSFCRVLLIDESERSLKIVAAEKRQRKDNDFRWNPHVGEHTQITDWKGLSRFLKAGNASVLREGQNGQDNLGQFSQWIGLIDEKDQPLKIQSLLTIPLKVGQRELGLMTVGELRARTSFTTADIEQGEAICAQISALIERLERDKKFLSDLFITEHAITTSDNLEETLKLVAAQVFGVAQAYERHVNVVDISIREEDKVRVVAAYPEERLPAIHKILGEDFDLNVGKNGIIGIVGRVILTGQPVIEGDVLGNPDYLPFHDDTRSQLVVPIIDGSGATIGAISVENSEVADFDSHDLDVVKGLASQAASAIAKDKQSRENKKVRTVALIGAAGSIWKHSFKGAVALIMSEVDRALSSLDEEEKVRISLAEIKQKAKSMYDFQFTSPLSEDQGIAEELLNSTIEERLHRLRAYLNRQNIRVNLRIDLAATKGRKVRINKVWFQYALRIFLVNAREAIGAASDSVIEVRTEIISHTHCRIIIKNTGPKIDDKIWVKLGNEQIERQDSQERGVGLLIADLILAVYGGKLEKVCNEAGNIVMGIVLPIS